MALPSLLNLPPAHIEPMNEEVGAIVMLYAQQNQELKFENVSVGLYLERFLLHHLGLTDIRVSEGLVRLLTYLSKGNEATVLLWAYTLNRLVINGNLFHTVLCVDDILDAFPYGFPSEAGIFEIWKTQMTLDGNALNRLDPWFEGFPVEMMVVN